MKTITEFAAITLKNAAKIKEELVASGKAAEELVAAMGESLKLEGDKLKFIMHALDVVGEKIQDLKRVIVVALNEGETAPPASQQKDENYYVSEYYPSLNAKGNAKGEKGGRDEKGGRRGDKRGDKRGGGKGRGGKPGGENREGRGDNRGARAPRPPRPAQAAAPAGGTPGVKQIILPKKPAADENKPS